LKGHGFSRADKANKIDGALAPEGSVFAFLGLCPRPLKGTIKALARTIRTFEFLRINSLPSE
jgi:hypothetical protein